jgi:hypothetical protein
VSALYLSLLLGSPHASAQAPRLASPVLDESLLREHKLPVDGPALLDFFRKRTPDAETIHHFDQLLARCASDTYEERALATEELTQLGEAIRPLLVRVVHAPPADREVLHRATASLQALPADHSGALVMAAARQLARHKELGALRILLDYLPYASDDLVRQELQLAINNLATTTRTPALPAMLKDADPIKRAGAAEALARADADARVLASGCLTDANPRVRLQVALALADQAERAAVPVLTELLAVLPQDLAWSAQECLLRLVDDESDLPVVGGPLSPRQVANAWDGWWQKHGAKADLTLLSSKSSDQGRLLLTFSGSGVNNAKVVEFDAAKKPLWEIGGLRYPVDVQHIGKNRVLIVEYLGRRVTERDLKGNILWQHAATLPIAAQRLPGGLTFIACRQHLLVVDRHGREVFVYAHSGPSIQAAQRLRDGHMVVASAGGTCHILDPQGREVKNFRIGQLYTMGAGIDVLPGGRILVPLYAEGRVVEYDFDGNERWKATVVHPTAAVRLPSGNTLVVSQLQGRVVEITPEGNEAWSYAVEGRPWRARRR